MIEAKAFIEGMRDIGLTVFAYSGRGMYNRYCVATKTGEEYTEFGIGLLIGAWAVENGSDANAIHEPSTDSLGLGTVLYWRGLEWPADMPHNEDEDEELPTQAAAGGATPPGGSKGEGEDGNADQRQQATSHQPRHRAEVGGRLHAREARRLLRAHGGSGGDAAVSQDLGFVPAGTRPG